MFTPQITQEAKQETASHVDDAVREAIAYYEEHKAPYRENFSGKRFQGQEIQLPLLSNIQIQQVFDSIETVISGTREDYLSALIQKSYNAGNNDFTITFKKRGYESFGYLVGKKENPIRLASHGNAVWEALYCSQYVHLTNFGTIQSVHKLNEKRVVVNHGIINHVMYADGAYALYADYLAREGATDSNSDIL